MNHIHETYSSLKNNWNNILALNCSRNNGHWWHGSQDNFFGKFSENFFFFFSSTGLTFCNVEHEAVTISRYGQKNLENLFLRKKFFWEFWTKKQANIDVCNCISLTAFDHIHPHVGSEFIIFSSISNCSKFFNYFINRQNKLLFYTVYTQICFYDKTTPRKMLRIGTLYFIS